MKIIVNDWIYFHCLTVVNQSEVDMLKYKCYLFYSLHNLLSEFNLGYVPRVHSKLGGPLPNPRFISNILYTKGYSLPKSPLYNVALTTFGQFLTHDVSSVPLSRGKH